MEGGKDLGVNQAASSSPSSQPPPGDPSPNATQETATTLGSDASARKDKLMAGASILSPTELSEEQERQDQEFIKCETEYLETLTALQSEDPAIARFRAEYEKMHKSVLRTRHHASVLYHQHSEIYSEYSGNLAAAHEAIKNSAQERATLSGLKEQIKRNEEMLESSQKREETAKEELRTLRSDIHTLQTTLKQGVGLSAAQERTLNELTASKEAATKELDSILDRIVRLRSNISDITERIRIADQQKRDKERDIFELKERNITKKADIDAELRNKERLDRDLRELRVVVAIKSQEVRSKQDAVNRANDEISILESQIRSQRQMLEKLSKDHESLQSRKVKLQQDCNDQITMTSQLIEDNAQMSRDVAIREAELAKNKSEVKKVNKMREALAKKNKALEEQRVDAEHERKTLRSANDAKMLEIEKVSRSIDTTRKTIDDLLRERDILELNSLKTSTETARHIQASILYKQTRHNLDLELTRDNREVADQLKEIVQLQAERDMYVEEAVRLQSLCVQGLQEIKEKESEIFEYKKKMIQAETKLKHQQNLYEAVQSDRNLHAKHLIESQAEIAEMKRRLKVMNFQINGYKEDINAKNESLVEETAENGKLGKDIEIITDEVKTLKNQNELAQAYVRSQLAEELKLNMFVKEAELERLRQENALQVLISERDNLSAQLIRQNEELARAYNKIKTQQLSLLTSENHYREKLKEINGTLSCIQQLRDQNIAMQEELSDLEPSKKYIYRLQSDLIREKARIKALEDELENPINIHRWRKLEGSNPKAYEMIQLLHTLQKNLIAKTEEDKEKEVLIESKEQLYLHLKGILAKQVGPEALEQVDEFQRILKDKQAQLKHMGVELNMYQAQVAEYKHSIDSLGRSLQAIKETYIRMRKSGTLPKPVESKPTSLRASAANLAASLPKISSLPPLPNGPLVGTPEMFGPTKLSAQSNESQNQDLDGNTQEDIQIIGV